MVNIYLSIYLSINEPFVSHFMGYCRLFSLMFGLKSSCVLFLVYISLLHLINMLSNIFLVKGNLYMKPCLIVLLLAVNILSNTLFFNALFIIG